jgi:phage head maturation protease
MPRYHRRRPGRRANAVRSAMPPRATLEGFLPGQPIARDAGVDLAVRFAGSSYNADQHTVDVVLSSGARVARWGIAEELEISPDAIDLTRVAQGVVPFLDGHDQSTDAKVGTVLRVWIAAGQLLGTVRFDQTTQRARDFEARVAAGELPAVSIGYQVSSWNLVGQDQQTEIWRATRWTLMEGSSVTVPADPSAAVRSAQPPLNHNKDDDMRRNQPGGSPPAVPATTPAAPATPPVAAAPAVAPAIDPTRAAPTAPIAPPAPVAPVDNGAAIRAAVADAVGAERTRMSTIADIGRRSGLDDVTIRAAIDGGEAVEAFRVRAFDALTARQAPPTSSVSAQLVRDERDTLRQGMAQALAARMARAAGGRAVELPEIGRRYGEMGIVEMAAEAIGWRGHLRTAAAGRRHAAAAPFTRPRISRGSSATRSTPACSRATRRRCRPIGCSARSTTPSTSGR